MSSNSSAGIQVTGPVSSKYAEILTEDALQFVAKLHRTFNEQRVRLLEKRQERQKDIDNGIMPNFLSETSEVRNSEWTIAPIPKDLQDRRVEITGPVDRKMIINALNSGAKVFMADFEDANSPTWDNCIQGQINLRDAVNRTISFKNPNGKEYKLNDETATLVIRPRGWHLVEKHVLVDGTPISASLFDFGLYFYHNAKNAIQNGTGPYFYLPKMESHLEARLWNDVFVMAQDEIGIPQGTIKATVLIETIMAAFEMDEILYELRNHSAGLNCGRWDYIFSYIKRFRNRPEVIVPDRAQVTMTAPFMRSYSLLCIKTCHKRKAPAIGGMAAHIPVKNDEVANELAFEKVRADKTREATDGHDGTWVAHPALVPVAKAVFDEYMPEPNQINRQRDDVEVSASDLIVVPEGTITEEGLRTNINVGIQYIDSWLCGSGAAPIFNLMEDAATAEISRAQVWQWLRHEKGILNDGRKVTVEMFNQFLGEEIAKIKALYGPEKTSISRLDEAVKLFENLILSDDFEEFLTLPGYEFLN